MNRNKSVKCKICGKKYVSKQALIDHIEKTHASNIPEGWNAARYENYLRTGKTEGRCVYCKKETGWNDATGKYNRMCGSEACKKKAREIANKNYIGLHGKPYTINDPEQQKKMVYGRKNSGKYIFEDEETGKKYTAMYDSSYGRDFFEMLDTFLNWDGSDIIAPSPHTYWYEYEGKKHFYIPDAYSTSLNLEIELKDGGDNPNKHPKIQAVDKVKEQKKDEVMASLKDQVNYIKICNKDYSGFFELLSRLKEKDVCQLPKWEGRLESITEGLDLIAYEGNPVEEVDAFVALGLCMMTVGFGSEIYNKIKGAKNKYSEKHDLDNWVDIPSDYKSKYSSELNKFQSDVKRVFSKCKPIIDKELNSIFSDSEKKCIKCEPGYFGNPKCELKFNKNTSKILQCIDFTMYDISGAKTLTDSEMKSILDKENKLSDFILDKVTDELDNQFDYKYDIQVLSDHYNENNVSGHCVICREIDANDEYQTMINDSVNLIESVVTDEFKLNRAESFSYYHLEEKQVKNGCWDEEQWSKTLPDAIKQELSQVSYKGVEGCTRKGNMTRFVYTLGKNNQTICLGRVNIYWYDWYDHTESPDYEWAETFGINMALIDEELNPIKGKTPILEDLLLEGKFKAINPNLIKRDLLLKDPMLNYDKLIDFYHKRLFHENLNQKEWQYTYNELYKVREHLQKVVNKSSSENDKRMKYEAKKALIEVNNMIAYMEEKNTNRLPVSEAKELKKEPVYIISWHYNSLVGYSSRIATKSYYNHTSISLTPDLEKCYAFSRNPEFTKAESTNGFCNESLSYMIKRHKESVIKVDAVYLPENCVESIKKSIEYHEKHQADSKFDYINFGRIVLGIELKETNPNKMICSMFVDKLFKDAGVDLTNGKPSNLVTPADIAEISETNRNVFTVYSGKAINYDKNKAGRITMESTLLESTKSSVDPNYKPKGKIKLSSLKRVRITESIINKYKKEYPFLKHVRCADTKEYVCDGYIWFDGDNLAAMVGSCEYTDDKTKWVVSLEITKDYKGYGLSPQILDYATKTMKCKYLSVNKNNKLAKKIYDDYGFKVYEESESMYYMTIDNNRKTTMEWDNKSISETYINSSEMEDNTMEGYLINQKDIYYNKDKFESGEINLCFITGHSGSGKSTMSKEMTKDKVEHYELDDLQCIKDYFTMDNLKEYGDLIYSYFNGPGKKFYLTLKEIEERKIPGSEYEDKLYPDFVHYAMKYAKSHKDRKYVIEGVWLFCTSERGKNYFEPSEFDDYAFYIKGTSALISKYRAAKRDAKSDTKNKFDELRSFSKNFFTKNLKWYLLDEKQIQKFRDYFSNKIVTESTYIEGTKDGAKYYPVFIFLSYTGTNMSKLIKSFTHDPYAHSSISFDTELEHMVSFNRDGMVEENIKNGIWKTNANIIKYSLYMYLATAEEYDAMRNFVNELLDKRNKLKYNLLGLTNFIFGRGSEREDRFFCSEFVSSVISAGNKNIIKTKPFMTSPYMLAKNKNFKFIKKGVLKNYNSKAVDNLIKDIMEEEGGFTDVIIK